MALRTSPPGRAGPPTGRAGSPTGRAGSPTGRAGSPTGRAGSSTGERSGTPVARALTKVPEIAAIFWVLKLLTTGMGEAMSDFLGQQSVPLTALIGIVGIWVALRLQLRQTEIAGRLVLSEATVKTHIGRILAKLELRDRRLRLRDRADHARPGLGSRPPAHAP